jgi:hypothetical protein
MRPSRGSTRYALPAVPPHSLIQQRSVFNFLMTCPLRVKRVVPAAGHDGCVKTTRCATRARQAGIAAAGKTRLLARGCGSPPASAGGADTTRRRARRGCSGHRACVVPTAGSTACLSSRVRAGGLSQPRARNLIAPAAAVPASQPLNSQGPVTHRVSAGNPFKIVVRLVTPVVTEDKAPCNESKDSFWHLPCSKATNQNFLWGP